MASFFDKAKDKATQLASQAKEKVDEQQAKRKADDLLDDIGRIVYRQRAKGEVDPGDEAAIDALVAELAALEAQGIDILPAKAAPAAAPVSDLPPPSMPAPAPTSTPEPSAASTPQPQPAGTPEPQPHPMPEPGA